MNQMKITIDYENNAETWWDALREYFDTGMVPTDLNDIVNSLLNYSISSIKVSEDLARKFENWAETLPGYYDGPSHAQYPIIFEYIE